MFTKLRNVPECLGNIDGVDYPADMTVKVTTHPKLREDVKTQIEVEELNISLDKTYHIHKITSYGDPFDVWITDDKGQEVEVGEWFFEDIDEEVQS